MVARTNHHINIDSAGNFVANGYDCLGLDLPIAWDMSSGNQHCSYVCNMYCPVLPPEWMHISIKNRKRNNLGN